MVKAKLRKRLPPYVPYGLLREVLVHGRPTNDSHARGGSVRDDGPEANATAGLSVKTWKNGALLCPSAAE